MTFTMTGFTFTIWKKELVFPQWTPMGLLSWGLGTPEDVLLSAAECDGSGKSPRGAGWKEPVDRLHHGFLSISSSWHSYRISFKEYFLLILLLDIIDMLNTFWNLSIRQKNEGLNMNSKENKAAKKKKNSVETTRQGHSCEHGGPLHG